MRNGSRFFNCAGEGGREGGEGGGWEGGREGEREGGGWEDRMSRRKENKGEKTHTKNKEKQVKTWNQNYHI